jgi:signal transduction histidine kinase/ligand-binding sensor domain-containing protein
MRSSFRLFAATLAAVLFGLAPHTVTASGYPVIAAQHASWTASAGAPVGIFGITQTPDGWLWIGSSAGLFRFDGVRFLRAAGVQAPLSSNIFELGVLSGGTLWVTYRFGGVSLMTAGRMRHFVPGRQNTPPGTITSVGRDADGRTWIGASQGPLVLGPNGDWQAPAAALQAPDGVVRSMLLDRSGTFWMRTDDGVFALPPHGRRFMAQPMPANALGKLHQHPDGSVWTSGQQPGLHLAAGGPHTDRHAWAIDDIVDHFLFDHAGNLWATGAAGVTRTSPAGPMRQQRTDAEHGLSGQHGTTVFEDCEQNIWVGTENGLDRFRPYRLRPLPLPRYLGEAPPLAAAVGGGAWIDRVILARPDAHPAPFAPVSTMADSTTALHAAPDGTLWSGGIGGLWKIRAGRREPVPMPPGLQQPLRTAILSLTTDTAGTLWASLGRLGVFALRDGQWHAHGDVPGLAKFGTTAIVSDPRGAMWFGSTDSRIALLERGMLRRFGRGDGLAVGTVLAILPVPGGAWIGGENGLAYFDGRRFIPVAGRGGEPFAGASGLVFGRDGTLWLNDGAGIASIAQDEWQQAVRDPAYRVRFDRLDYRDGLLGGAAPIIPLPSAIRSADGTMWFSTTGGVFAFDPAALPRNPRLPPVVITAVKAGAREYPVADGLRLPPLTRTLELHFTALAYRAPERVNFRYRLDGVDAGWQDMFGRRMAQYTNLAPGRYRFRVIASNDDGVWNETGAALSFEIAPSLTQTVWFRVLCGAVVLLALWLLHRMRLRRVARRVKAQMNTRLDERERIARELHDTLLQSIMGLVMQIGAAVHRLRDEERGPLEEAVAAARRVVSEGRDRVAGLRGESLRQTGLARAMTDFGAALARDGTVAFDVVTTGTPALLDDGVADNVLAIAREAVWNAFMHAQPRRVTVTLAWSTRTFALTVADDGCGIPPDVMASGARPGHWGLPGLRERAAAIGATLELASGAGAGTTWTLSVPLSRASATRPAAAACAV